MSRPRKEDYEPIAFEEIPVGTKWKPSPPHVGPTRAFVSLFGAQYRLVRELDTGAVTYFKRKGAESPAAPKEQIDAEPERPKQQRFRVGAHCWFVDDAGRWFCCKVVSRRPNFITISPITGLDADRKTEWHLPNPLEIRAQTPLFCRIRKLKDRNP